nr:hypothetical protein [Trebouxia sp. A1-2]
MCSAFLVIVLNFQSSFNILVKIVGYSLIDRYFPLSKIGIRGALPVTVFFFTFLILVIFESYSIGGQQLLREQKFGEIEREIRKLGDAGLFEESGQKIDLMIEERFKARKDKGFLGKIINHPKIFYYINFFRMEK